ncbi:universal stress protein [Ruegeria marina]|uniref:Nucleotide-binding universal stress protein, UspA family n=1 Tax=Ruegeria marina TaxID=639004 RepID=A0A1G7ETB8_9RHOB|nr:universal stress protein [Ruegeria marina]SDE66675.1 Nucleotide-binding universal stress protein, UspA family [Ruegeria marina]
MSKYAEERIVHPQKYYRDAEAVAHDAKLTTDEKQRVLDSMALNAELMATATEEGMTGGERPPSLKEIKATREKLLASTSSSKKARFQTIVVALNGDTEMDEMVAQAGFDMASTVGGKGQGSHVKVHVINVIEPTGGLIAGAAAPTMAIPHMALHVDQQRLDQERARRSEIASDIRHRLGKDQPGDDVVVHGEPSTEITRFASEREADLIVLGAVDRSWFEKLLGISPTQEVAENARCPILFVPTS